MESMQMTDEKFNMERVWLQMMMARVQVRAPGCLAVAAAAATGETLPASLA
jgi:hypothetical protein